MKNKQRGSLSFLPLLLLLCISLLSQTLITALSLGTQAWLRLEAYTLARAHLYGQNLHKCSLSPYWPQNRFVNPKLICGEPGQVQVLVSDTKLFLKDFELNLRPRSR